MERVTSLLADYAGKGNELTARSIPPIKAPRLQNFGKTTTACNKHTRERAPFPPKSHAANATRHPRSFCLALFLLSQRTIPYPKIHLGRQLSTDIL